MNRRNVFLWVLYDFANSLVVIVFYLYFSQWLVVERGVSDFFYNLIFIGSATLTLLTAPVAGLITDKTGVRFPYLRFSTIATFLFFGAASFIAVFYPSLYILAAVAFLLANYFYLLSFSFYNPLLVSIAPVEKRGIISGLGQASNLLGQIAGILVALPLVTGSLFFFGGEGRAQAFVPLTIVSFLLTLPMLFWFKETEKKREVRVRLLEECMSSATSFLSLCRLPGVGRFLLGYFLFNNGLLTVINNFPIYLEKVFGVPDTVKSFLILGILVAGALGAVLGGWAASIFGLRKITLLVVGVWIIISPLLAILENFSLFAVGVVVSGLFFGASLSVMRAMMASLVPPERLNYAFSFYTIFERLSTFLGPLVWGGAATVLFSIGPDRYRVSLILVTTFIILAFFVLRKIPGDRIPS